MGKHEKKKQPKQPAPAPRDKRAEQPRNGDCTAPDGISGNWD